LIAAARFEYSGLGGYDPFYDSGVYLESARMIRHGYPAYIAVFSSQPPLWLPLVRFSLYLFGENFFAGQLLIATATMITIAAVITAVAQLQGYIAALLAAALLAFSPVELGWSHSVIAEAPSAAFAAVAIAASLRYPCVGRRVWLVAAAIAMSCSILIKLFGLFTVPAILLLIIGRWSTAPMLDRRARLQGLAIDILIIGAILLGAIAVLSPAAGLAKVWDQAVRFHLTAARLSRQITAGNRQMVLRAWPSALFQWIIFALGAFCLFGGWRGVVILIWWLCIMIGLLLHRPLFEHHLLALIPAAAIAAALGWGQLWSWSLDWCRATRMSIRVPAIGGAAVCLALAAFLVMQGVSYYRNSIRLTSSQTITTDELAAERLRRLTARKDFVLTDAQGIAFLAERDVPPGLTDTSFKRIATGYLSASQVIDASERYDVRAALLWTGRLNQIPEVSAWVRQHFSRHESFDGGRVLWFSAR
jgi:4-amino-4-deoxy-L-arabinose transferase-like glycosyltransferase